MARSMITIAFSVFLTVPAIVVAQSPAAPPAPKPSPAASTHRWLDLQTLSFATRYRFVDTTAGVTTSNHGQHNETVKARFTVDARGRYALVGGLGSGATFIGGWNNAGVGTPNDLGLTVSLKQLYVSAAPWKGVEAHYGGLYVVRGESTEITSYDNDGYLAGGRLSVKRPDRLGADEISATFGYLGETTQPNFLRRADRLSEVNYYHVLVSKKLTPKATMSGDITRVDAVDTLRSAITIRAPKTIGVDLFRVEAYRRLDNPANGYAVFAEKAFTKRVTLGVGTADIDVNYGGLNADRFGKGQRWFANGSVTLLPELSLLGFYQRAFSNDVPLPNRSRAEVILQFNALKALQRAKWY